MRKILTGSQPICWEYKSKFLYFWGDPKRLPSPYFDQKKLQRHNFNELDKNIQLRLLYSLFSKSLSHRGLFFESRGRVYLPNYESLSKDEPKLIPTLVSGSGRQLYQHEAFNFSIKIISNHFYFVLRPAVILTKDGFSQRLEKIEKIKNKGLLIRINNRYSGKTQEWVDFWIDYLARNTETSNILFDLPDLEEKLKVTRDNIVIESKDESR
jgi:hypothetical protein